MSLFHRSRSFRVCVLLIVDAWIFNVVSWTAHLDSLQHSILFISAMVSSGIALVVCGVNLIRIRREMRVLETKMVVLEVIDEFFKRLESKES